MGAARTSNVEGRTSGVASAFFSIIIIWKSFVVNFLVKKLSRFFVKLLSRFCAGCFLRCFFFFLKTMCLVVNSERQAAKAQCRNTSYRQKRRVGYEKISLHIICPLAKFPQQHRVNYEFFLHVLFAKLPRHPL